MEVVRGKDHETRERDDVETTYNSALLLVLEFSRGEERLDVLLK